ncbi:unnamed protein product [Adineta steineri]|uniref:Uncharacterized protein n=1 Tax=Adineta steineri TaxID=433720 RepID=A0A814NSD6_9BILA|nr:unnamed protein product [Adineta steineri]CAF1339174.1 unnamed protein product [Adineta steineri]
MVSKILSLIILITFIVPTTTTITTTTTTNTMTTTTTTTTTTSTSSTTVTISTANWLINGDAETGPCETGSGVTHPTGWNYNGTVTQVHYNDTYADISYTDHGPSDRGNCYFYGQADSTSMWQTVNMTSSIDPLLIDSQTVGFNFSAWLGGYSSQDDNAEATLTFYDQSNHKTGNISTLGPVLVADRGSQTLLLFRQTQGLVPIGARSFTVTVIFTHVVGLLTDADVDNIAVHLY